MALLKVMVQSKKAEKVPDAYASKRTEALEKATATPFQMEADAKQDALMLAKRKEDLRRKAVSAMAIPKGK